MDPVSNPTRPQPAPNPTSGVGVPKNAKRFLGCPGYAANLARAILAANPLRQGRRSRPQAGPASHIAFHLIELLADAFEPSHLPAGYVSLPGFTQPLDALPVAIIEVETVGKTFVYQ
jgi:hypothetical protein